MSLLGKWNGEAGEGAWGWMEGQVNRLSHDHLENTHEQKSVVDGGQAKDRRGGVSPHGEAFHG